MGLLLHEIPNLQERPLGLPFPEDRRLPIDELFIETQPAHLQKTSQQKLNAEERDFLRAEIIRGRLKLFPKPDMGKVAPEPDNETASESNNNE